MEGKKYLFVVFLGLLSCLSFGQNKEQIYNAFISGDMEAWKAVIDRMDKEPVKTNDFKLELLGYHIGYIGYNVGLEEYDIAKKHIELAQVYLDELKKDKYKPSYTYSSQGALDGLRMGINKFACVYLGPKIVSNAEQSVKKDCLNAEGYILIGNSKYYMWAMLGGSKKGALEYYKTAERALELSNKTYGNWCYLSLLTMIAHAYFEMDNYTSANNYYRKILDFEPNYSWIRDDVYPDFLVKSGIKNNSN